MQATQLFSNSSHRHTQNALVLYCSNLPSVVTTFFRSLTLFCGTNIIIQNIPHIHIEHGEYSTS